MFNPDGSFKCYATPVSVSGARFWMLGSSQREAMVNAGRVFRNNEGWGYISIDDTTIAQEEKFHQVKIEKTLNYGRVAFPLINRVNGFPLRGPTLDRKNLPFAPVPIQIQRVTTLQPTGVDPDYEYKLPEPGYITDYSAYGRTEYYQPLIIEGKQRDISDYPFDPDVPMDN
jgi:hypothetical protein